MIYLLFVLLIVILALSYMFTKDIFSPPCMICESYVLAVFCAILNIDKWGISLHEKTVYLILYGVLLFVLSYFVFCILSKLINNVNMSSTNNENTSESVKYIEYQKYMCLIL